MKIEKVTRAMIEHVINDLAVAPQPIAKLNGVATSTKPESKLKNFLDAAASVPLYPIETEVEMLKAALEHISPDDLRGNGKFEQGKSWLAVMLVGASLGDPAKEVVRSWSMKSDKYDEADFDLTWKSYNPAKKGPESGKKLTVASLHAFVNPTTGQSQTVALGDIGNAIRFANMFGGNLKFIRDSHMVIEFDDFVGWKRAKSDAPITAAKAVVQKMAIQAANDFAANPDDGNAAKQLAEVRRTTKKPALDAMISLARSEDGMSLDASECDADNFVIGVPNGVVDLDRGILLAPDPNRFVTKRITAEFDPDADCPRYKQFLREAIPNAEERTFLNRFNGYILSGSVVEQKLLFLLGIGANGKTVWIELTSFILGDYASKIQTEMLMNQFRSSQAASPDLVRLQGRRFIYANETTEGRFLDDARVKDMTGGDTITGRMPYAVEAISFTPTHKLIIAGNHAPIVTDDSEGMWRRMILMPFTQQFKGDDCDPDLPNKLRNEASGILNYWLDGYRDWRQNGLQVPSSLIKATNVYRNEQDLFAQFVSEKCEVGAGFTCLTNDLKKHYFEWCEANHTKPMSGHRFGRKLKERGFSVADDKRTRIGIQLKEPLRYGLN